MIAAETNLQAGIFQKEDRTGDNRLEMESEFNAK
jgi:hypothetical protein